MKTIFTTFLLLAGLAFTDISFAQIRGLSDKFATKKTRALYLNLGNFSGKGVLIGHQDALAYGVTWKAEKDRSDIKDVCGDYPAVVGWDISKIGQRAFNIDTVDFKKMKGWIKEAYKMGSVNTISWHMDNPVTKGNSWDKTAAVSTILPGGVNHGWYKNKLDLFVDFANDLKVGLGTKIPIIFRPFHEHTGNWFWWGRGNCTAEEYIALWRFTVEYLTDIKGLHHLIYAYSTDRFKSKEDFLEFYPGDAYVDIIAYDDYHSIKSVDSREEFVRQLKTIVNIAKEKGKIAALSETGLEKIPVDDWFTNNLLGGIKSDAEAAGIVYVLLWRNAWPSHYYAPYEGHSSADDFIKFYDDPYTIFSNDLIDIYKSSR